MENATKALIIAAAVLIAIVLVALGIKLLGSTGNTAETAETVGNSIGQQTHDLSSAIQVDLIDTSKMTDLEFSKFIYNNYAYEKVGEISGNQVLKMCNLIREKYGSLRDNLGGQASNRAHITSSGDRMYNFANVEKTVKENLSSNIKYVIEPAGGAVWSGSAYLSIAIKVSE